MSYSTTDGRPLALVTGLTGGVGGAVGLALLARGWQVRTLHRDPLQARALWARRFGSSSIEWVAGDALDRASQLAAARGAQIIFHGVNPPRYRNWRKWAIPMLGHAIEAARVSGARLVFPGNVYNFDAGAARVFSETAPQHPTTRKGQIRVEMEQMLRDAASQDRVRSLVVRAGDFFGPTQPNSWLAQGLVKPGRPIRSITYPGDLSVGHTWAYLPDLAATLVDLAARESELPDFETFHFRGHWIEEGRELCATIARVCGASEIPVRRFPWWLIQAGAPFVGLFRELLEMRYLWDTPLELDNSKLVAFLGRETHTPLEQALKESLAALGCLREGHEGRAERAVLAAPAAPAAPGAPGAHEALKGARP